MVLKIKKNCKTCQFNFGGECAGSGELEYGSPIDDFKKERSCWVPSLDYSIELTESLPEHEKDRYLYSDVLPPFLSVYELVYRLENGHWIHNGKKFLIEKDGKLKWIK